MTTPENLPSVDRDARVQLDIVTGEPSGPPEPAAPERHGSGATDNLNAMPSPRADNASALNDPEHDGVDSTYTQPEGPAERSDAGTA